MLVEMWRQLYTVVSVALLLVVMIDLLVTSLTYTNNQWMSIIKEQGNIYIYEILESHTIIEWLSRMNVKDEYVKTRVINPGGWVTGRPGVLKVQVRTKYVLNRYRTYQYVLLYHNTPSFWRMVHQTRLCYMCGSARTELKMWCAIVVNRWLTTRVKHQHRVKGW